MLRKRKESRKTVKPAVSPAAARAAAAPRIIGGSLGGRRLLYAGPEPRTRAMKDRVREALFNLLGGEVAGKHAVDLFAGTGALGFEATSRGAARATFIEQHFPTAAVIRQNAAELDVADRVDVRAANAFLWAQRPTVGQDRPWLVFCSPPYAFYVERQDEMLALVEGLVRQAPVGSVFVVECDGKFDTGLLPEAANWDTRQYAPAVIAIYRK